MKLILFTFLLASLTFFSFGQSQATIDSKWTFQPDYTFTGSKLAGWHLLGQASWRAKDGEIIGTAKKESTGGWLVLDQSYQDVGFRGLFKCNGNSETGILFRMEKTNTGFKGVLLSITKQEVAPYRLTLDAQGKELQREKLRYAGGIFYRLAPPASTTPASGGRAIAGNSLPRPPEPEVNLPIKRPNTDLRPGEWNQIEIFMDLNVIRTFLNDGREIGGAADEDAGRFGPVALWAKGPGEVRFKDIGLKDISLKTMPKEQTSTRFRVQRISDMYYSWGADAGDYNKDGVLDVVAGPYVYLGPDFTDHREIYPAISIGPSKEFTSAHCQYTYDFNNDGWPDILTSPNQAILYINPKGESRRWDKYEVIKTVHSEITEFKDIDGDGKPELIYGADGSLRYAQPDPKNPIKPWKEHLISEKGYAIAHGIGTGDINNDGRLDILNAFGWWEQPATLSDGKLWSYHPEVFARYGSRSGGIGGSIMAVYDANGDGLNDVVTNLNAHGFGLAWFEQKKDAAGKIAFVQHMLSDDFSEKSVGNITFSQPHGATFADIDKDGIPDFIVGKRYWTHLDNYYDPDPYGPPVLYWYRTVRNPQAPGGAEFVPELIHNRSGAGSEVTAVDLNKDGTIDLITSTDRGTFIYWNK